MDLNKIISKFAKVFLIFPAIVVFFFVYNHFLVDNTIEQLRFSLEQTAQAYDVTDLDGIDLLLSQLMVDEIIPEKINLLNVANLEYAKNAITGKKNYKVIDSVKTSLGAIIKDKEKQRNKVLVILDNINRFVKKVLAHLNRFKDRFTVSKKSKKITQIDARLLEKAQILEKSGKYDEALVLYNDFSNKNAYYEKIGIVMLRMANIYSRKGQHKKAVMLYKMVIKSFVGKKESYIAQMLLYKLDQIERLRAKANSLLASLVDVKEGSGRVKQDLFYQLGAINLGLYNLEESKRYFNRAAQADPKSPLAAKSKFVSAWVSKEQMKMSESVKEFSKLIEDNPNSVIAMDSRYQIADVYQKEGKFQEAINIYVQLAAEYKGDPVASLCLFQAAASYMYDLNDDEKAKDIFSRLVKQYPGSPYAQYVSTENPVGIFITYLVPRATRVVAWRVGGLLALSGYSGKIVKFTDMIKESEYVRQINDWLKDELPDTVGNLYVDIKGAELKFLQGKATGSARFTIGKFSVFGEAEGHLEGTKDGSINLILTKMLLEHIPVPPVLINRSLNQVSYIIAKHFPIHIAKVSMNNGEILIEGYGSERIVKTMAKRTKHLLGNISYKDIVDMKERKEAYDIFKKKFPENDFSTFSKTDNESMFLDFFTRMYLYAGFKMLETVKDTKLDYERSVRTLGRLAVKKGKFKVNLKEKDINASLNKLINSEFPWVIDEEFIIDLKGIDIRFAGDGKIRFVAGVGLGKAGPFLKAEAGKQIKAEGRFSILIDEESKLPRLVFEEVFLDGKKVDENKFNLVTLRCFNLMKDSHIPFELEEIDVESGSITLRGSGARDFTSRIFSDPSLFVIFQVREWDLAVAGIERVRGITKTIRDDQSVLQQSVRDGGLTGRTGINTRRQTFDRSNIQYEQQIKDVSEEEIKRKFSGDKVGLTEAVALGRSKTIENIINSDTKKKTDKGSDKEYEAFKKEEEAAAKEEGALSAPEGEPSTDWAKNMPKTDEYEKAVRAIEVLNKPGKPGKKAQPSSKTKKGEGGQVDLRQLFGEEKSPETESTPYMGSRSSLENNANAKEDGAGIYISRISLTDEAKRHVNKAIEDLIAAKKAQGGDDKKLNNLIEIIKVMSQSSAEPGLEASDTAKK